MAAKLENAALGEIGTLFAVGTIGGLSDGHLIEQFLSGPPDLAEAAFAALVDRHGAMVMGVCRRLLSDPNDADDAFQATFLVLVRRARSIARRELLANWLYGVAFRTARVTRTRAALRLAKERHVIDVLRTRPTQEEERCGDLLVLLDEELSRLPEKFQIPVVLCELEGRSRKEVALRLGIAEGTLSSRLARARELLRKRFERRGLALGAGALAAALPREVSAAAVRPALATATVQAALRYATGGGVNLVSRSARGKGSQDHVPHQVERGRPCSAGLLHDCGPLGPESGAGAGRSRDAALGGSRCCRSECEPPDRSRLRRRRRGQSREAAGCLG